MKTLYAATILAVVFSLSGPLTGANHAEASSRKDRVSVCDWYRTQAQFASLRGNQDKSEFYWHLFRACMNDRID
jgi:hypothetical protein